MSELITDEELREMRETAELAAKEAPGEWRTGQRGAQGLFQGFYGVTCDHEDERRVLLQPNQHFGYKSCSRFVVAAQPSRVLRLLDERAALGARAELAESNVDALRAERRRLQRSLAAEQAEVIALIERLAEPAPSDEAAADRSIKVFQDGSQWGVSLESSPDWFHVICRTSTKKDADIVACSALMIVERILTNHVAQLRAELAAVSAAAPSSRLKAAMEAWRAIGRSSRKRVLEDLNEESAPTFMKAADLLAACSEAEQPLSTDGETSPETPESKRENGTES